MLKKVIYHICLDELNSQKILMIRTSFEVSSCDYLAENDEGKTYNTISTSNASGIIDGNTLYK